MLADGKASQFLPFQLLYQYLHQCNAIYTSDLCTASGIEVTKYSNTGSWIQKNTGRKIKPG